MASPENGAVSATEPATALRIGIVAGEASGDILGANLMRAILREVPDATFIGIGGAEMRAIGMESLYSIDVLSINGFKDPILRLPSLIGILRNLVRVFTGRADGMEPVDVVIGVDFNVFNLLLERIVHRRGVPTVHYVSPSVYFWRRGRLKSIRRSTDVVLALYPFEPRLYSEYQARAVFVGHPIAREIDLDAGSAEAKTAARRDLGLDSDGFVIALLPGSRGSEIEFLGEIFLATAALLTAELDHPKFIVPVVNEKIAGMLDNLRKAVDVDLELVVGESRKCIQASDFVLTKSGTATLETMLLRRPMVITYRVGTLTAAFVRALSHSVHVGLPNILHGGELVPELLQEDCEPEKLCRAVVEAWQRYSTTPDYLEECERIHRELRLDDGETAARAVLDVARDLSSPRSQ